MMIRTEMKECNGMKIEQTTWCILNEVATTSLHRLISFSSSFLLDWAYTLVTRKPGAFRKIYFMYIWNVLIRIHSSPETKKTWDGTLFKFLILWNQQAKKQRPFFFGGEAFKISEHKKWAMAPKTEPWPMGACLARAVDWRDGGFCSCFQATAESGKKSFPDLVQLLGFHPPIFLAMKFRPLWKRKSPRSLGDENVMTMVVKALHRCDDPSSELAAGIFFSPVCCQGPLRFYADSQDSPWTLGRFAAGCGCV